MFTIQQPSVEAMQYITRRCSEADPFLKQDLQDECAPGLRVSVDARKRMPDSYFWRIAVQAPPCFFGDFNELWKQVQKSKEVPAIGMLEFASLLRLSLAAGGIPKDSSLGGHVYLLSHHAA
jgi:hypothetical protein